MHCRLEDLPRQARQGTSRSAAYPYKVRAYVRVQVNGDRGFNGLAGGQPYGIGIGRLAAPDSVGGR